MVHVLLLALMRYAPHQKVNTQNKNPTHQTIHINATKKKDNIYSGVSISLSKSYLIQVSTHNTR